MAKTRVHSIKIPCAKGIKTSGRVFTFHTKSGFHSPVMTKNPDFLLSHGYVIYGVLVFTQSKHQTNIWCTRVHSHQNIRLTHGVPMFTQSKHHISTW